MARQTLITVWGRKGMKECGCVIRKTNQGVCVKLCRAHGYGTDMLPVLCRFLDIFSELEGQHGHRLLAAYTDTLHEAQALLWKGDERQEETGSQTAAPPSVDTQNVRGVSHRRRALARVQKERAKKLA